ncbi:MULTISPECIES: nickel-responsive transcriptional regulator NikR [Acetobacter]|uniref:Putative nickel-responsive regulator n=1 Tax=Acetobacter thailandicus TaxID=1502842 RepID=A0ABT3QE48_9PROT|nr:MULTISPECIES: nickel-responsive transcriptional regulator NikR [Acetobacter]MBS0960618.1 nickel-responsive transcriptional regulator NikR [Acetobacter thailandicus]MBS0980233.1 nickel-responsive transcriptional regulator NikR [Acetobacter thailandicus]MBS0986193.1 nickel-responsive transcriptional regulator NikR [Acetobacter thailandicus]MBS1004095.1 nickel-responsive transcriptional regulator NikR [Acetobacter thailandicus]MCX2563567.1 nickel-responsive transcriptional regulator NikR [Acet
MSGKEPKEQISRISVSLSPVILRELDAMVEAKGYASRSQAIQNIVHQELMSCRQESGDELSAGVIILFYNNTVANLPQRLADLQYENLAEVISSLHVNLIRRQTLEVLLVQGKVKKLQEIADQFITLPGVISGRLHLIASLIPPVHETGRELELNVEEP